MTLANPAVGGLSAELRSNAEDRGGVPYESLAGVDQGALSPFE
jgi:hypothetical protein